MSQTGVTTRRALTLLEVLVVCTMMTSISLVTYGWIQQITSQTRDIEDLYGVRHDLLAITALLHDDLLEQVATPGQAGWQVDEDGSLHLLTLHGADHLGLRRVRWFFDDHRDWVMRDAEATRPEAGASVISTSDLDGRPCSQRFTAWRFEEEDGNLWLAYSTNPHARTTQRIMIWTATP